MLDVESAVKTFMQATGQLNNTDNKITDLRLALIEEEYSELLEAIRWGDHTHIAKEGCDLIYVIVGTLISLGIPFNDCFAALQTSNLSKLDANGNALRRPDGKILKGPDYQPAEIAIKKILATK